jgi:hypothetical protein
MAELLSGHKLPIQTILVNKDPCKRIFIHGPPGTSKSFTTEILLKDNNYDPVYLDAVEVKQNKGELIRFVDKVLSGSSHFGGKKCLVVDNILGDYVSASDRDTKMVIEVLTYFLLGGRIEGHPKRAPPTRHALLVVIADCNITKDVKALSALMHTFKFKPYNIQKMKVVAKQFAEEKEFKLSDEILSEVAQKANGDIRQLQQLIHLQGLGTSHVIDTCDAFSVDVFSTTRLLMSNKKELCEREGLIHGNLDMIKDMMFHNYPKSYKTTNERVSLP